MNSETFREFRPQNPAWLLDETEKFIRKEEMHNAVIDLINALDEKKPVAPMLETIKKAETFTFNSSVGHNPLTEWELVYNAHHSQEENFPFELKAFQENVSGVRRKSENVLLAATSVGKSLTLVHLTGQYVRQGKTVVYLSMEMDHVKISKRIHATLLNVDIETIENWEHAEWKRRMEKINSILKGRVIVQDYPTGKAHVGHFKSFLDDLKRKQNITPDVIIVDYLNLCASRSLRGAKNSNRYQEVGCISNELRALAQETNTVLWTATQTNRNGYKSDANMENTSESYEVNSGCDLLIGINKDENDEDSLKFQVLKNRNGKLEGKPSFVPVDKSPMRLYDTEDTEYINDRMKKAMVLCSKNKEQRRSEAHSLSH